VEQNSLISLGANLALHLHGLEGSTGHLSQTT